MQSQARNLIIVKRPRIGPAPDKSIDFPPFDNLHLEFLEVKRKLKQGLPLISLKKRGPPKPLPIPSKTERPPEKTSEKPSGKSLEKPSESKKYEEKKHEEDIPKSENGNEDDDLLAELGEEDHVEIDVKPKPTPPKDDEKHEDKDHHEEHEHHEDTEEHEEIEIQEEEDDPYAGLSPEEREAKEREEYIWRFRILKKQYKNPQIDIPSYNEHSDLPEMKRTYDRTIKELYLDDAVETYRTYLMGGFIVMEFVCIQWVGVDLSGFTIQQTKMMYKYDRLLIELGEKSYSRWGMNLPVEVRLIGFILLQAGIFYLGKIISNKFGNTIAELFKGVWGLPPDSQPVEKTSEQSREERPKKKMRGPKIRPDDIRNMDHVRDRE